MVDVVGVLTLPVVTPDVPAGEVVDVVEVEVGEVTVGVVTGLVAVPVDVVVPGETAEVGAVGCDFVVAWVCGFDFEDRALTGCRGPAADADCAVAA